MRALDFILVFMKAQILEVHVSGGVSRLYLSQNIFRHFQLTCNCNCILFNQHLAGVLYKSERICLMTPTVTVHMD